MTEAEWLVATDPIPMLGVIRGTASDRKLQLFAASLVWAHREQFPEALLHMTRVAELRADDLMLPEHQCEVERRQKEWLEQMHAEYGPGTRGWPDAAKHAIVAAGSTSIQDQAWLRDTDRIDYRLGSRITQRSQPSLLREAFGNPFRPLTFSPEWRTSTVVALAQQMYESRDFSAMPILADALQDAGCENADILDHCRDANGVHVRGCWVVDLVLVKT